jgi:aminoglycoside phosphotransferase family enzyme/predicted kinase
MGTTPDQERLVAAFHLPVIETHISYVLLAGAFAYKIKKAVRFEFLDFTTLAQRRFFCHEELRLNRRLAPLIYLDVVPISGTMDAPVFGGDGVAIEYAVKMRQFDQAGLLSRVIERDELTSAVIEALAREVAAFHTKAPRASTDLQYAQSGHVRQLARDNFTQMRSAPHDAHDGSNLERLHEWTESEGARLTEALDRRRHDGFVRECHGDLHLGNIALIDGRITLFDCLEFNPSMRWSDVMSDVAFLVMDLHDRNRPDLAARFLSAYLEDTSDYGGLTVLPFYIVYRALVRAKVASMRLAQPASRDERAAVLGQYRTYLNLAVHQSERRRPSIVITHGVTGSGKTVRSQALVESMGAVRVRSDVERKRLFGLDANARSESPVGGGLYTDDASRRTYARLTALARTIAAAGFTAVLDAAFLKREQRDLVREVANDLGVPFIIADCSAPAAALKERVSRRLEANSDASEATLAVLERQLASDEPLAPDELASRQ